MFAHLYNTVLLALITLSALNAVGAVPVPDLVVGLVLSKLSKLVN
jgi:hypothetical protein